MISNLCFSLQACQGKEHVDPIPTVSCSVTTSYPSDPLDSARAEVPGSPIFMMQLCSGARHIEVQIVGDQPLGSDGWPGSTPWIRWVAMAMAR